MLNGTRRMVEWMTVEVRSITHEFAEYGRSLSNFNNTICIQH